MKLDHLIALFSAALIIFGICVRTAPAADIPAKAAIQTATTPMSWSGIYIFGTMGYGWRDESTSIVGNNALSTTLLNNGSVPGSANTRPSGALLGGGVGVDWQFAPRFVAGLVGDWSWANIKDNNTALGNLVNRSVDEKITSFGTLRARLGYLVDPKVLIYATGGVAWANVRTTVGTSGNVCGGFITCSSGANSETKWGAVAGGGLEFRLTQHWSLSAEALYGWLGTQNTTLTGSVGPNPLNYTLSEKVRVGIARGSLSYRF